MHLEETPAISAYMWAMVGLCLATPFFPLKKNFAMPSLCSGPLFQPDHPATCMSNLDQNYANLNSNGKNVF